MERIETLKNEIFTLKKQLQQKEKELYDLKQTSAPPSLRENIFDDSQDLLGIQFGSLSKSAISRYSRQILLPEIGVHGQERLCQAKVLIVGAGGLGCPAAAYLAGAGVGEIGIIDYDTVEVSNIHRQILHSEDDEGMSKAESAANCLRGLNCTVKVTPYAIQLDSKNAVEIASNYDVVLDCTDNVPTRYLLNDLCCYLKIPLVSGSALKLEGQLTIYGYKSENSCNEQDTYTGPCYRCVFPLPPHPDTLGSCSSNGVAGPVPGVIGCLQALEAIKYIVGMTRDKLLVGRMLLFDGEDLTFRNVKLRPQNIKCTVCVKSNTDYNPILDDYELFCNSRAKESDLELHILSATNRISAKDLASKLRKENQNIRPRHLLVDVRSESEYNMCRIDGAVNYPMNVLKDKHVEDLKDRIVEKDYEVTFLCRRGNDSQLVAKRILDILDPTHHNKIKDLAGGLHAWSKDVDENFPIY